MKLTPSKIYDFRPVKVKEVREFIETNHYSGSINGCKITQCYGLYCNDILIGAMLFGELSTTAWKKYANSEKEVIELRRLCTMDDCVKNTESWFISQAIKHIKKTYDYKMCISYADAYHDHIGYVYQATNWQYLGRTNKDTLLETPEGRLYHSRALRTKYKGDYKPFVKKLRALDAKGLLKSVVVPGKYIYRYMLKEKQQPTIKPYPKVNT